MTRLAVGGQRLANRRALRLTGAVVELAVMLGALDQVVHHQPVGEVHLLPLLLFAGDEATGFRISFDPPCPGLSDAKALSFVSVTGSGPERFDSIMLEDGTRCYFRRVVPSVFD